MSGFNPGDLSAKLQQLQQQVAQFQQATAVSTQPQTSYPRVTRTDTVEDILSNPQWRQELENEFLSSEMGTAARNYREVLFHEFCEKQTGRASTMLDGLRQEAKRPKAKGGGSHRQTRNTNTQGASDTTSGEDA